jgi:hypothetical protein
MADYDGLRFAPAGGHRVAGETPVGVYRQHGDLVTADFSGGAVRAGRLVGTTRPDGTIDASYCMVHADGEVVAGACVSTPSVLADGRIRLTEHWRRLDGSSGISQVEQVGP